MPLYDFHCAACAHAFEALVRHDPIRCPSCGSDRVERQIGSFAVSSDAIRHANVKAARRAGEGVRREKAVADLEAIKHHDDHHR